MSNKKNYVISFLIGTVIGLLILTIRQVATDNQQLSNEITTQQEMYDKELKSLREANGNLVEEMDNLSNQLNEQKVEELTLIEPIKQYDKKLYFESYKKIVANMSDAPETIYDYTTDEEFNLICSVIEAEAGVCDFSGKISVANVIISRYMKGDKTWSDILTEKNQFSTIANGAYKRVVISDDTRLSLEYAFLFGDENTKDCLYFRSGSDNTWHDESEKLEEVYYDGFHHYYIEKEKEE